MLLLHRHIIVVGYVRALIVCLFISTISHASDLADAFYKAAQKAEKAGDTLNAYLLYSRAAALDPANPLFAVKKVSLRLATARLTTEELGPDPFASDEQPAASGGITARDLADARQAQAPPRLAAPNVKKSFNLKGDARTIFEQVLDAFGIQVIFDADYQSPPPFTFRLNEATFDDALHGLEDVSNSFAVAVNPRLALVSRDTQGKRNEHMPVMAAAIPIAERMSAQDAQEMLTAVQQSLDIRRVVLDPTKHQVVMRAEAGKVNAARDLFAMLSQIRPQIEVDVEFLSVDKNSSLGYGISLPNQISIVNFVGPMSLPMAYQAITHITGPNTPYGVGIGNASILATLSRASATNLLDAQLVALDGQAATLHVGDKYPIATNQYVGNTAGQVGQVYTPPPTINFEDLGLVLKVTPSIHEDQEITLDLEAEFKTLGATSPVAGIPIVNNRSYKAKVRMHEGEWAIMAGLVETTDVETRVGWPGLMSVPILGRIFSQNTIEHDSTEVLLVLKPHIVALPPWENPLHPIWVGTESRPLTTN